MSAVVNAAVSSVVARCLLDPGYLDRLTQSPDDELAELPVDAETRVAIAGLDFERVRLFAGFISKVQHNDLWDNFPGTRALLKYCGAELATFADYRAQHLELGRAAKPSRAAKTLAFLDFLESRLRSPDAPEYPGLLDVLTHERLHWEVTESVLERRLPIQGRPAPGPVRMDTADRRAVVAWDAVRVAVLSYDPLEVKARLRNGGQALSDLSPKAVCLCYWGRHSLGRVSVLTVDPPTAAVLAAVDDGRPVHEVLDASQTLLPEADRSDLARILDAAAQQGLVRLIDVPTPVG
ncbi:hypothetical protein [Streptomyces sp. NPDC020681]|uniref:hypothetical protein n=1 Tax=Streptomyces sp. NPDC020681 TaxID=3365083 RepID=UPI0037A01ECA